MIVISEMQYVDTGKKSGVEEDLDISLQGSGV